MYISKSKVDDNRMSYSEHSIKVLLFHYCRFISLRWSENVLCEQPFCFLNKKQLVKLRLRALRAGVWFRALPRIDKL
jgi:hypothetical protein